MSESGSRKRKQRGLPWRLSGCLARARAKKKKLKRPDGGLGCGGKGAEDSSQRRRFLPLFHKIQRLVRFGNPVGRCNQ